MSKFPRHLEIELNKTKPGKSLSSYKKTWVLKKNKYFFFSLYTNYFCGYWINGPHPVRTWNVYPNINCSGTNFLERFNKEFKRIPTNFFKYIGDLVNIEAGVEIEYARFKKHGNNNMHIRIKKLKNVSFTENFCSKRKSS